MRKRPPPLRGWPWRRTHLIDRHRPRIRRIRRTTTDLPKDRLQRAIKIGVKIAMGSDARALLSGKTRGEATLFELKKLSDEGMASIEIIRSATVNAAELLGWSDRVGELAAGKFADIIAVAADPVVDIGLLQHVQFVMKGATVVRNDFGRN